MPRIKNRAIFSMDSACYSERRAFLKVVTTTTAALAMGGCGGGAPNSTIILAPTSQTSTANPPPGPTSTTNLPPVWQTMATIAFTQGIASSVSIAAYVSDADGDAITITKNSAALPAGVVYEAPNKRFVYDGVGAVASTSGHVLTANDGQP